MNAVLATLLSDLRHRRLQTAVIAFVLLLTSGAATLALSLLVETDAPYDHAFARAHGAHLMLTYSAPGLSAARLRATAGRPPVTGAVGPWPLAMDVYTVGPGGISSVGPASVLNIVGRSRPDTPVDRLTLESGGWVQRSGEVVVTQTLADSWHLHVGDELSSASGNALPTLRVVGIAASINRFADAWVLPAEVPHLLTPGAQLQYQMMYRVRAASTDAELRTATQQITAGLPPGAVHSVDSYLQTKRDADLTTAVMIPFLLAFSAFALLASVLIIANVVSGVVIAGYRDIGIMKAIGFTPGQVIEVLFGQVLVPALAGCVTGIALGTIASQPFLQDTAHALGLPAPFTAAIPVDLGVLLVVALVVSAAAIVPAWSAARRSAVTAITIGTAPSAGGGSRLGRLAARWPLPRAVSLGLGDSFARPLRAAMTAGAILSGVATIVFALSLHLSLGQVAQHLLRDQYVQVNVQRFSSGPGGPLKPGAPAGFGAPPTISDSQAVRTLQQDPGTQRMVAETRVNVHVPGIAEPVPYVAYRGDSSWLGYAIISGRWFSRPDEVVAPTRLLNQAHLRVGDSITAQFRGKPMRLRIVGEILDQDYGDLVLRGSWSAVAAINPHLAADRYEVQLKAGVNADAYARRQPNGLGADVAQRSSANTTFALFNAVIAGLALVLITIAVMGVFNTVILNTRERVRDIAVLKAVGMAPFQVVLMVVASVSFLGVCAGAVGIPVGLELHRQVLTIMGQIASSTRIPPAFFALIPSADLPLLALAGAVIAAIGAWLPAQWAASSGVAEVLQTE